VHQSAFPQGAGAEAGDSQHEVRG
ncbi:hypothetical protein BN1723_020023, partial [Verticillium longisporum]